MKTTFSLALMRLNAAIHSRVGGAICFFAAGVFIAFMRDVLLPTHDHILSLPTTNVLRVLFTCVAILMMLVGGVSLLIYGIKNKKTT